MIGIPLSSEEIKSDFQLGHTQIIVYNEELDLLGVLTSNYLIPEGFILVNHRPDVYPEFSDAIGWSLSMLKKWAYVGEL